MSGFDLQLDRKIVVIDDTAGYTSSFNMVAARFFNQDAGVGEWIDAMVRLAGSGVLALNALFRGARKWRPAGDLHASAAGKIAGSASQVAESVVQVIPSGPGRTGNGIYQLLLSIYSARHENIITTPYFVPDDAVSTALLTAAERGAKVAVSCRSVTIPGWCITPVAPTSMIC